MAYDFSKFKKNLIGSEDWIKKEFSGIRTGQASPMILDSIKIESYGSHVPISQVGSIALEGPRTLRIVPWDQSHIKEIEKAITISNLGVSVIIDDRGIRINFPELTMERRKEVVKIAKERLEEGKKQIRIHRDEIIKDIQNKEKAGGLSKDDVFRYKNEVQKMVDEYNRKLDDIYSKKEKEILN